MTPEQRRRQRRREDKVKTLDMVIVGTVLVSVAATVIVISLLALSRSSSANARANKNAIAAKLAARVSCQRSRELGPPIGRFLNRNHALPARAVVDGHVVHPRTDYAATIPKRCP